MIVALVLALDVARVWHDLNSYIANHEDKRPPALRNLPNDAQ